MSPAIQHTRLEAITGPLMVIADVAGVGWDEVAEIRLESGEVRHGVVLDVHDDLAVVEVFEGTGGIGIEGASVSFSGSRCASPSEPGGWGASATAAANRSTGGRRSSARRPARWRVSRSTPRAGSGRPIRC